MTEMSTVSLSFCHPIISTDKQWWVVFISMFVQRVIEKNWDKERVIKHINGKERWQRIFWKKLLESFIIGAAVSFDFLFHSVKNYPCVLVSQRTSYLLGLIPIFVNNI